MTPRNTATAHGGSQALTRGLVRRPDGRAHRAHTRTPAKQHPLDGQLRGCSCLISLFFILGLCIVCSPCIVSLSPRSGTNRNTNPHTTKDQVTDMTTATNKHFTDAITDAREQAARAQQIADHAIEMAMANCGVDGDAAEQWNAVAHEAQDAAEDANARAFAIECEAVRRHPAEAVRVMVRVGIITERAVAAVTAETIRTA